MELYPCVPWSAKQSKMAQPDLDYIAPEVQAPTENGVTSRTCSTLCDMFSLGQTICAIYNNGKSLLQCNHNPATYTKRLEQVRGVSSRYVHQASPAGTYTKRREQVRTPSVSSRYVHQASRAGTRRLQQVRTSSVSSRYIESAWLIRFSCELRRDVIL